MSDAANLKLFANGLMALGFAVALAVLLLPGNRK